MKTLLKTGVWLLVFAAAFSPAVTQAFNSGTHLYIAERVFPFSFDKIDLYYGSVAPDLSLYIPLPLQKNWPDGFVDTHYEVINLPYAWWNLIQTSFSRGWKTHNEIWGADYYAHICFFQSEFIQSEAQCTGYVIAKAAELVKQNPFLAGLAVKDKVIAGELAHFAVEVAVDLLILKNEDHALGQKLLGAAFLRSPEDLKLLTKSLVVTGETDLLTLSSAESTFRDLLIEYGSALALPGSLRMPALGVLGAQVAGNYGLSVTPAAAQAILVNAVDLCEADYWEAVQAAIAGISRRMK